MEFEKLVDNILKEFDDYCEQKNISLIFKGFTDMGCFLIHEEKINNQNVYYFNTIKNPKYKSFFERNNSL